MAEQGVLYTIVRDHVESVLREAAKRADGALSLFAGIILVFFLEYWERITREQAEGARPAIA